MSVGSDFVQPLVSFHGARHFFLLATAWVDPGRSAFSQLSNGVKDAMVGSTELVKCHFVTKTCRKDD